MLKDDDLGDPTLDGLGAETAAPPPPPPPTLLPQLGQNLATGPQLVPQLEQNGIDVQGKPLLKAQRKSYSDLKFIATSGEQTVHSAICVVLRVERHCHQLHRKLYPSPFSTFFQNKCPSHATFALPKAPICYD